MFNTLVGYVMTFWSLIGKIRVSKFCNLKIKLSNIYKLSDQNKNKNLKNHDV